MENTTEDIKQRHSGVAALQATVSFEDLLHYFWCQPDPATVVKGTPGG